MTPPTFDEDAAAEKMADKLAASVSHRADVLELRPQRDDAVLFPVRTEGDSTWVCVKCLPQLIHG